MKFLICVFIFIKYLTVSAYPSALYVNKKVDNLILRDDLDKASLITAIDRQLKNFSAHTIPPNYLHLGDTLLTPQIIKDSLQTFKVLLQQNKSIAELSSDINKAFTVYTVDTQISQHVTFTGFYHMQLNGSLTKTDEYRYPIYECPQNNFKKFTRKEIDNNGVLHGLGFEILWLNDPFERFDLHIQGSGTVVLENGKTIQLNYACSNDYPFKSVSKKTEENLFANPRYIFFQKTLDGPLGTNLTHLTAHRSIATDKTIFPLGGIVFISFNKPMTTSEGKIIYERTERFVIDQTAGNAIKGPYRADLYFGEDDNAQQQARALYDRNGQIYYLVKN